MGNGKGNTRGGAGKGEGGLTRYERRFVSEYLIDLNGKASMIRMGFVGKDPAQRAYEIRHRVHVDAAIELGIAALQHKNQVTAEQVVEQYRRIAFSDIKHLITVDENGNEYIDISQLPDDRSCAIASFEADTETEEPGEDGEKPKRKIGRVKIRMKDSLHALDKLGIHTGIFRDDQAPAIPVRFIIENAPGAVVVIKSGG